MTDRAPFRRDTPPGALKCPLCESGRLRLWRAEQTLCCSHCGLLQRKYAGRDDTDLDRMYAAGWCEPERHLTETGGTCPRLAHAYTERLLATLGLRDFSGLRILDFGAGRGEMALAVQSRGGLAFGVDRFGFRFLRARGLAAFGSLDDLTPERKFNGIVSIDVVEHLACPWRVVPALRERLTDGGWFYLATPNASSAAARLLGQKWGEANKPGHLWLFTPASLELLLRRCGFGRVERVRWRIPYSSRPARRVIQYALQAAGLDGQLRYLAFPG
jgi:SAM-dependent methyltransferase